MVRYILLSLDFYQYGFRRRFLDLSKWCRDLGTGFQNFQTVFGDLLRRPRFGRLLVGRLVITLSCLTSCLLLKSRLAHPSGLFHKVVIMTAWFRHFLNLVRHHFCHDNQVENHSFWKRYCKSINFTNTNLAFSESENMLRWNLVSFHCWFWYSLVSPEGFGHEQMELSS